MTPTSKTIQEARKILSDPSNWWNGSFGGRHQGMECLGTALSVYTGEYIPLNDRMHAHGIVQRAVKELFPLRYDDRFRFTNFNDHPDTTHADVLKVLDRALEIEREERG